MNKQILAVMFFCTKCRKIALMLLATLVCYQPSMWAQPTKPAEIAEVPANLSILVERFIETINSNQLWNLGPLMRPDLSKDEAISVYLKNSPDLAARKLLGNIPDPREGESRYIQWEYFKPNERMWIAVYALKGQSRKDTPLSTLWVQSANTWKLVGAGWPLALSIEQADKRFHENKKEKK